MSSNAPRTPRTPKTPRTPRNPDAELSQHIAALCHLMMSSDNFEPSSAKLAPILGISHAKNVPRKINSIINPHGFEFKGNKIIKKDDADAPAEVPADAPANVPANASGSGDDASAIAVKKEDVKAVNKTPAKKRKIEKAVVDDDEEMTDVDGDVKQEPQEDGKKSIKNEEDDEKPIKNEEDDEKPIKNEDSDEKKPSEYYAPSA